MEKLTVHTGLVAPLDRSNVDTDAIIPKQFLKSIYRTGYGPNCFDEWRYLDKGEPGMDNSKRPINPDFVLNEPRYRGASILLARKNFGCGSSREQAPEVIKALGIRAVIAKSFARIFFRNSINNGLLLIENPDLCHEVNEGDEIEVNVGESVICNGKKYEISSLPENLLDILNAGGLVKAMRRLNGLEG